MCRLVRVGNADKELILCPIELRPQCGRNLGHISRPNYKVKEKTQNEQTPLEPQLPIRLQQSLKSQLLPD